MTDTPITDPSEPTTPDGLASPDSPEDLGSPDLPDDDQGDETDEDEPTVTDQPDDDD